MRTTRCKGGQRVISTACSPGALPDGILVGIFCSEMEIRFIVLVSIIHPRSFDGERFYLGASLRINGKVSLTLRSN